MLLSWMLTALRGEGPYLISYLHGPPGSGKTTLARFVLAVLTRWHRRHRSQSTNSSHTSEPGGSAPPRNQSARPSVRQRLEVLGVDQRRAMPDRNGRLCTFEEALHERRPVHAFRRNAAPVGERRQHCCAPFECYLSRTILVELQGFPPDSPDKLAETTLVRRYEELVSTDAELAATRCASTRYAAWTHCSEQDFSAFRMPGVVMFAAAAEAGLGLPAGSVRAAFSENEGLTQRGTGRE